MSESHDAPAFPREVMVRAAPGLLGKLMGFFEKTRSQRTGGGSPTSQINVASTSENGCTICGNFGTRAAEPCFVPPLRSRRIKMRHAVNRPLVHVIAESPTTCVLLSFAVHVRGLRSISSLFKGASL